MSIEPTAARADRTPAADAARAAYEDSCRDLVATITSLESALVTFTGKEEGVRGQVFAKTRARCSDPSRRPGA